MRPKWQGIALVAVCGAIWLASGIGCGKPFKAASTQQAKKTYTREEFRKLVVGKTKDEVLAAFGRPDSTREPGDGNSWTYSNVSHDPVSGKADMLTRLHFDRDNKVKEVSF